MKRAAAIFISCIAANAAEGVVRTAVTPAPSDRVGFTLQSNTSLGIAFTNRISEARVRERQNIMNGAGLAVGDFDRDGKPDVFFCNKEGSSALYRNLGNWRFEDATARAGVACTNQSSSGATFADINGDGWLDLLVTSFGGPNACLLNRGDGTFTNVTATAGILFRENMTSLALADIDGDADLDLYVANFGLVSVLRDGVAMGTRMVNGVATPIGRYANRVRIVNGEMTELGEPDFLFANDGKGNFKPLPWPETFGMPAPPDFGLAVQMRDINGDGQPDVYVCNDFQTPDRMWLNEGGGKFAAAPVDAMRTMSFAAMGVDFADIDRDGDTDFVVVEMLAREASRRLRQDNQGNASPNATKTQPVSDVYRNTLYLNNGDGTYSEIARLAGVSASDWSWCPIFLDVDLDGYEDLLITNGNADDTNDRDLLGDSSAEAKKKWRTRALQPLLTPNVAFRNRGDMTFEEIGAKWGFDSTQISHGMALGDFDGDGDQDVAVNCWNAPPLIYRNDASAPRILVRLRGSGGNTQGIGSAISVSNAKGFVQTQEIISGGRYMSGDDPARMFACVGDEPFTLEVRWRSGRLSRVEKVLANSIYEITEPTSAPETRLVKNDAEPMFEDVSAMLSHTHQSEACADFERQPLLPRMISNAGGAFEWRDVNNDARADLVFGNTAFLNSPNGFKSAAYKASVEGQRVAQFDFNSDGKLDFLVAETSAPGRFPEPANAILRINGGSTVTLTNVGSVNGIACADFNGDGLTDAAFATEWGPLKVFLNEKGALVEATARLGLDNLNGLWLSVAAGDFNGDGRVDLVAGNWGRNTFHSEQREKPLRLYYGDWMERGAVDMIEARFNPALNAWAPERSLTKIGAALPFVKQHFATHAQYAGATVESFLPKPLKYLEAGHFESTIFLNRGDRFEARALPALAQFTPVLGIAVADFDGDAKNDLFLAQNFFGVRSDCDRFDAGFGLVLRGRGDGTFEAIPASQSGIRIQGEQRACAAADFDGDGRVDLAVAQQGGETKLYRNRGKR